MRPLIEGRAASIVCAIRKGLREFVRAQILRVGKSLVVVRSTSVPLSLWSTRRLVKAVSLVTEGTPKQRSIGGVIAAVVFISKAIWVPAIEKPPGTVPA